MTVQLQVKTGDLNDDQEVIWGDWQTVYGAITDLSRLLWQVVVYGPCRFLLNPATGSFVRDPEESARDSMAVSIAREELDRVRAQVLSHEEYRAIYVRAVERYLFWEFADYKHKAIHPVVQQFWQDHQQGQLPPLTADLLTEITNGIWSRLCHRWWGQQDERSDHRSLRSLYASACPASSPTQMHDPVTCWTQHDSEALIDDLYHRQWGHRSYWERANWQWQQMPRETPLYVLVEGVPRTVLGYHYNPAFGLLFLRMSEFARQRPDHCLVREVLSMCLHTGRCHMILTESQIETQSQSNSLQQHLVAKMHLDEQRNHQTQVQIDRILPPENPWVASPQTWPAFRTKILQDHLRLHAYETFAPIWHNATSEGIGSGDSSVEKRARGHFIAELLPPVAFNAALAAVQRALWDHFSTRPNKRPSSEDPLVRAIKLTAWIGTAPPEEACDKLFG